MDADALFALADTYDSYATGKALAFSGNVMSAMVNAVEVAALFAIAERLRGIANLKSLQG